jgi:hypothetical protein
MNLLEVLLSKYGVMLLLDINYAQINTIEFCQVDIKIIEQCVMKRKNLSKYLKSIWHLYAKNRILKYHSLWVKTKLIFISRWHFYVWLILINVAYLLYVYFSSWIPSKATFPSFPWVKFKQGYVIETWTTEYMQRWLRLLHTWPLTPL